MPLGKGDSDSHCGRFCGMVERMVKKHIKRIGWALDRIGAWATGIAVLVAGFGTLVAAMTWLGRQLTLFGSMPWPETIFIGIGTSLLVVLILSGCLVAWRYFRPLRSASDRKELTSRELPQVPMANSTDQFFSPTVTLVDPPPFKAEHVYVGQILVGIGQLEEKRSVEISIRGFNGSGHSIFVQRTEGKIIVEQMGQSSKAAIGELPLPWLSDKVKQQNINHGEEFSLLLEQRVTDDVASLIRAVDEKNSLGLNLDELNIFIGSHRNTENLERLPLWNGVRLSRSAEQLHCGRVSSMKAGSGKYGVTPA